MKYKNYLLAALIVFLVPALSLAQKKDSTMVARYRAASGARDTVSGRATQFYLTNSNGSVKPVVSFYGGFQPNITVVQDETGAEIARWENNKLVFVKDSLRTIEALHRAFKSYVNPK